MTTPPSGISEADWVSWPAGCQRADPVPAGGEPGAERPAQRPGNGTRHHAREGSVAAHETPPKPPSSDGPGFKPPDRRHGRGLKRRGQQGHPGSGPGVLPIERIDEVVEHHPDACRHCGPRLSTLVVLLSRSFCLSFGRTQTMLNQLLGWRSGGAPSPPFVSG